MHWINISASNEVPRHLQSPPRPGCDIMFYRSSNNSILCIICWAFYSIDSHFSLVLIALHLHDRPFNLAIYRDLSENIFWTRTNVLLTIVGILFVNFEKKTYRNNQLCSQILTSALFAFKKIRDLIMSNKLKCLPFFFRISVITSCYEINQKYYQKHEIKNKLNI